MSIYCTYLTTYRGNKLPPFYIGSTSVEKIHAGYRGSVQSKAYTAIWKAEQKDHPDLFSTRIITTHNTRDEATIRELLFLKSPKVSKSPMYINMYDGQHFDYMKVISTETKQKMSLIRKGKKAALVNSTGKLEYVDKDDARWETGEISKWIQQPCPKGKKQSDLHRMRRAQSRIKNNKPVSVITKDYWSKLRKGKKSAYTANKEFIGLVSINDKRWGIEIFSKKQLSCFL